MEQKVKDPITVQTGITARASGGFERRSGGQEAALGPYVQRFLSIPDFNGAAGELAKGRNLAVLVHAANTYPQLREKLLPIVESMVFSIVGGRGEPQMLLEPSEPGFVDSLALIAHFSKKSVLRVAAAKVIYDTGDSAATMEAGCSLHADVRTYTVERLVKDKKWGELMVLVSSLPRNGFDDTKSLIVGNLPAEFLGKLSMEAREDIEYFVLREMGRRLDELRPMKNG